MTLIQIPIKIPRRIILNVWLRSNGFFTILMLIALPLIIIAWLFEYHMGDRSESAIYTAATAVVSLSLIWAAYCCVRIYCQGESSTRYQYNVELSEEYITIFYRGIRSEIPWSKFRKIHRRPEYLELIFDTERLIIPTDSLPDGALALLNEKLEQPTE